MKKKKLSLGSLKVNSFVTEMNGHVSQTAKAGNALLYYQGQQVGLYPAPEYPSRPCPNPEPNPGCSVIDSCPSTPRPCDPLPQPIPNPKPISANTYCCQF